MSGVTISPSPTYLTASAISFSTTGAQAVVAGVSLMKVRVFRIALVTTAANTMTFQDGSNNLSGAIALGANGSITLDNSGDPWFTTSAGNAFNISAGNATQVSGMVYFTQTPNPPIGG